MLEKAKVNFTQERRVIMQRYFEQQDWENRMMALRREQIEKQINELASERMGDGSSAYGEVDTSSSGNGRSKEDA